MRSRCVTSSPTLPHVLLDRPFLHRSWPLVSVFLFLGRLDNTTTRTSDVVTTCCVTEASTSFFVFFSLHKYRISADSQNSPSLPACGMGGDPTSRACAFQCALDNRNDVTESLFTCVLDKECMPEM